MQQLIEALPRDFPASLFITTHLPSTHESYLPEMLSRPNGLPVTRAVDGQPIEPAHVYVAAADRHLLLLDSVLCLGAGPRENMARPSIDPMFRSAALSFGARAVGVVLSGLLNDGSSGLYAIKQAGGTAVVQHPLNAAQDEMPCAAMETAEVDYVAPASDLADILRQVVSQDAGPSTPRPDSLLFEVEVAKGARIGSGLLRRFSEPAALTCPDCGGVLSEMRGQQPLRYRCQIGHAFTAEDLAAGNELLDEAVRVAMRVMEERVELVSRMGSDARSAGRLSIVGLYEQRAEEYGRYAATLRKAALLSLRMARRADEPPA